VLCSQPRSSQVSLVDTPFGFSIINRLKALIYIDLFNIKQASDTDPYPVPVTGHTNAYGSYIESKVKALNKLILLRYFP
jgi:hypothetical protein